MTEPTSSRNESIYDETDPDIELKPKKSILRPVPSNPSTNAIIFAMFGNGTWSYLATFGMTGRSGLSFAIAFSTMCITAGLWVREAKLDYEKWEGSRKLRERNLPKMVLPRTIFDWDEFSRFAEWSNTPTG